MSTGLPNEATNLPPRPVDAPGFIGEQLVTQITNKVADAKLKEKDDRIAGLKKKSAKDALKLTGAGMFWFSSALALNITEWQKIAVAFAIWMFFYFILTFVYAGASALLFFRIRRGIRIGVFVNFILMFVYVILEFIGEKLPRVKFFITLPSSLLATPGGDDVGEETIPSPPRPIATGPPIMMTPPQTVYGTTDLNAGPRVAPDVE